MELILKRKYLGEDYTIGELTGLDKLYYVMEDVDRGLKSEMTLEQVNAVKVHGVTAIPYGRYEVVITMSNRFKVELPLLVGIKGYAGVRIHAGNYSSQTEGCLLPGLGYSLKYKMVSDSRTAMKTIFEQIKNTIAKKEKVFISIIENDAVV